MDKSKKKKKVAQVNPIYRRELCDLNNPDERNLLVDIVGKSLNPTWPPKKSKKKTIGKV